jgi:hypothetical protein
VRLAGTRPQMSRQLDLPLVERGEAPVGERSEEVSAVTRGNERSGASELGVPRLAA